MVSELIRHSSVSFTEEIYIHLKDKYKQDTNYLFFKPHFRHYALGIGGIIFDKTSFSSSTVSAFTHSVIPAFQTRLTAAN